MAVISAVAYARYSSDKQQESSITVQLAEIHKFCAFHGIHLIREYIDEAQTGTNSNRKQFQQMIKDAPNKEFQFVIVHRMDRWARNVDDARYYKKYLKKHGIKIVSAIEEFDETPEGEFFELISMGIAELYSKKLARECIAGKIANAKEGRIHGGCPPLGYTVKGKYYVIEPKEAEAVKIIFDMVVQGYGYSYIRDFLNANGYRHADGRLFTAHFYDILRNRKYIGEYIYNRSASKDDNGKRNNHKEKPTKEIICIPGAMPQIIDRETFGKVQTILDERKRESTCKTYRERTKYVLSGLLRCAECGKAICGGICCCGNNQQKMRMYRCGAKGRTCTTRTINADYLDEYVYSLFVDCLFAPENNDKLCELVKYSYIHAFSELQEKRNAVLSEIANLDEQINSIKSQLTQDLSKVMQKYLNSELENIKLERTKQKINEQQISEELTAFPEFDTKLIKRNAKEFAEILKGGEFTEMQSAYRKLISVIRINNDTVNTTVNLQVLLENHLPLYCTVIETRDFIARPENHHRQTLTFSQLKVRVD